MKTEEVFKSLKTNEVLLNNRPLGYTHGLPMISHRNGTSCLVIPYLKYQMTGQVDKTRVFPPRFVVTVIMNNGCVVKYEDLAFDYRFQKIEFNKPVGLFRHAAIRQLNKEGYLRMRGQLYESLDRLGGSMMGDWEFSENDSMTLSRLISVLLEPSVKPFYHAIDKIFYETYIQ